MIILTRDTSLALGLNRARLSLNLLHNVLLSFNFHLFNLLEKVNRLTIDKAAI